MTEDTEGYSFGEELVPVREGHTPRSVQGPYTFWDDERQTYVLAWGAGAFPHAVGFALADWADSLLKAVEAIRADPAKLADAGFVRRSLHDGRQLRQAIEAVEDELLRAARAATGEGGEALLSWRQIGGELGVHHTTVMERHTRLLAGESAARRGWLMQGTTEDGAS